MTDTTTTGTEAVASQDDATTADATTSPADGAEVETFDAEYVSKLRKEAAEARIKAKANADAAKRLAALEDANKSETEKLNDRATKAETEAGTWRDRYLDLSKRQAITEAAAAAKATDTETVYLYLRDEIEVDDDGSPVDVDKAIRSLAKRKPHLFRTAPEGSRDAFTTGKMPPALNSDGLTDALSAAVGL